MDSPADIVGSGEISLVIDEHFSAASLTDKLRGEYPALSSLRLLIAVNEKYADAETMLNNGDEVAVFTAVSGG